MSWKTARPGEQLDHRLQLHIASEMVRRVRVLAGRRGISASEAIRQLVQEGLDRLGVEDPGDDAERADQ